MKRNFALNLLSKLMAVILTLSSCANPGAPETDDSKPDGAVEETPATSTDADSSTEPAAGGTRIMFTFEDQTVYGTLDDNSVSRDLISRLPLTLTFSDYSDTEKIAYLPEGSVEWDMSDSPDSCTPEVGEIAMYSPWGNLSVFYRAFRESSGLVPLGRLEEGGAEKFATMSGDFLVTIALAGNPIEPEAPEGSKLLVAYFSCTGNTKAVAEKIAELTGGELYEIVPSEPYTSSDLNYNNNSSRANREMNDPAARPGIAESDLDISEYDTVIIGYPIWWGTMPRIINTFLDTYDLSGKTVLPFCTSGGSGISSSVSDIKSAEPDATVTEGLRASGANDRNLEGWLRENGAID